MAQQACHPQPGLWLSHLHQYDSGNWFLLPHSHLQRHKRLHPQRLRSDHTDLQTINPDSTSTTVAAAPNPASLGQAITFTATVANTAVAAITPMGKATFQDVFNGVTTYLGTYNLVNGVATFTTSALAVGSHAITATYSGAADFSTSGGTLLDGETVNPISTTIAVQSALSPASFGQTVTYTATVAADSGRLTTMARCSSRWMAATWAGP